MAVTTQNSTEYTNAIATPVVTANAVADKGKLRTLQFTQIKVELVTQVQLLPLGNFLQVKLNY